MSLLSSTNIFYRATIIPQEEEAILIDSNDVMDERINEHKLLAEKEERQRKPAIEEVEPEPEFIPVLDEEGNPVLDENGDPLVEQLLIDRSQIEEQPAEPDEPAVDYIALAREEAEHILTEAKMQADEILVQADNEASALKDHIREEARKEGFDAGLQEAAHKAADMEKEVIIKRKSLEEEYDTKFSSMERELVTVITDVVSKVFSAELSGDEEIIYHLLDNTLSGIESSKSFLIRVNEDNCSYIRAHKEELLDKVGHDVNLDIVTDPLLTEQQCMIETDGGLFDCGLDAQMRNLVKKIRALS